jgi:hypothetical protein
MLKKENHKFDTTYSLVTMIHLLDPCGVELRGEHPSSSLGKGTAITIRLLLGNNAPGTLGTVGSAGLASLRRRISLGATWR